MKKKIIEFKCDFPGCKKRIKVESEYLSDRTPYPYDKGWVYLYNHKGKVAQNVFFEAEDNHFCGGEHLIEFIQLQITRALKEKKIMEMPKLRDN